MTDRLDEFDSTNFTTGLGNWAKLRRDSAIANLTRRGAGGGQALGRANARMVANKLYRNFNTYIARGGTRQADAATLTGFIARFWPSTVPELAQEFPGIVLSPQQPAPVAAAPAASPTPAAPPPAAASPTPAATVPQPQTAASPPPAAGGAATPASQPPTAPAPQSGAASPPVAPDWSAARNAWRATQRQPAQPPSAPDVTQQLRDIGRKIAQRVQAVGEKRAADDPELRNLEAEQQRLLAQTKQQEGRSPNGNRLVEADPSLSIPAPPTITRGAPLNFGRKGVAGPPPTGPAQPGTPPAYLRQQRNNVAGARALNRAQIDRVFYALAFMLLDSGHANIGASAAQPNQANQPQSVAGQTMAKRGGFGMASVQKMMNRPISSDVLDRSQSMAPSAAARIPPNERKTLDNLLAGGKTLTMSQIINAMGKMSPSTVQGLMFAAGYA